MKETLQDPMYRNLIVGGVAIGLAFLAYKVPVLAPVCTLVGTWFVPAGYRTSKAPGAE